MADGEEQGRALLLHRVRHEEPRWFGHCPACSAWNTRRRGARRARSPRRRRTRRPRRSGAPAARQRARARDVRDRATRGGAGSSDLAQAPVPLRDVELSASARWPTGIRELDRVLGGGVVPGLAAAGRRRPGIGKSTLLLQLARALARAGRKVLYVAGEESRAAGAPARRTPRARSPRRCSSCARPRSRACSSQAARLKPDVVVVDSIQTADARRARRARPGSVTQVRECALALLAPAKGAGARCSSSATSRRTARSPARACSSTWSTPCSTSRASATTHYRVLRAAKNRFGSTHELGVFAMAEAGLREVDEPERGVPLGEPRAVPGRGRGRRASRARARCWSRCRRWSRPPASRTPQRVTNGFDSKRLALLLAVLERRVGRARSATPTCS